MDAHNSDALVGESEFRLVPGADPDDSAGGCCFEIHQPAIYLSAPVRQTLGDGDGDHGDDAPGSRR